MQLQLKKFHSDEAMREAVKEYIGLYFSDMVIEKAFKREDVSHMADAKEAIDGAFDNLDIMFNPKAKKNKNVNEAR